MTEQWSGDMQWRLDIAFGGWRVVEPKAATIDVETGKPRIESYESFPVFIGLLENWILDGKNPDFLFL